MLPLLLQVYPTVIRAFGMALCSAMSRIGGMTAPFIAQVRMSQKHTDKRQTDTQAHITQQTCAHVHSSVHSYLAR